MFYCDSCNASMQSEDMFAVSPRYDLPTNPRDVSRVYCRSCAQERFFDKLGGNPSLIRKSNEMAVAHLTQSGRM